MNYAILEKGLDLAHAEIPLDEKLSRMADQFVSAFSFDQCLIYLRDTGSGAMVLRGYAGAEQGLVDSYPAGAGLVGAAVVSGSVARASVDDGSVLRFEVEGRGGVAAAEIEDQGLAGFSSAVVVPFGGEGGLRGVVFLKAFSPVELDAEQDGGLRLAVHKVHNVVRCATLMESRRKEHMKLEEIQEKLVNAEKLMALGDMAAILAHEVKNPIISLGGYIRKIKKAVEADDERMGYVDHMLDEVRRVEKIINGVIRFLRDNVVELELGDANSILDDAIKVLSEDIRENRIKVVRDFYEEPLLVLGDREQLKIAFDNLISNAIQSMAQHSGGRGGTLRVSTTRTEDTVVVRISDSGGGIDPKVIGYIFNPFFTTKERGTGLGLAITNSIVMRHKGIIEVNNEAGVGVTFIIQLPCAESKEAS